MTTENCAIEGCDAPAEWVIDDKLLACQEHVGDALDPDVPNLVVPIKTTAAELPPDGTP